MFKGFLKKDSAKDREQQKGAEKVRAQRCYEVAGDILKAVFEKISNPSEFSEISIDENAGTIYYEDNNGNESMIYNGSITHSQAVALEWVLWNELKNLSPYKAYMGGGGKRVHHRPNRPNDGIYTGAGAPEV